MGGPDTHRACSVPAIQGGAAPPAIAVAGGTGESYRQAAPNVVPSHTRRCSLFQRGNAGWERQRSRRPALCAKFGKPARIARALAIAKSRHFARHSPAFFIEGDLDEDSSEGTTSGKCADVGGKEPAATDTGKDGDLVEGSSKETSNEPMNANSQEEESRYAADCASQGRQVGPCGFAHLKAAKLVRVALRARRANSHCSPPGNAWNVRSHTTSCALMRPTRKV